MGDEITITLDAAESEALRLFRADMAHAGGQDWRDTGDFARDILVSLIVTHLQLVAQTSSRH